MAILWKEEYSVGLDVIDEQHKKFIDILNRLSESFLKQERKKETRETLKELREYAESHFAFEEKYFHAFHYENTKEHEGGHATFRLQVQHLSEQFNRGDDLLEYDLLQLMSDWLISHIMKEDKKYVECFKEHGLK